MRRSAALAAALLAAPVFAAGTVTLRNDPAKMKLAAGAEDATVVVVLDIERHVGTNIIFQRYDVAARTLAVQAKGDKRRYGFQLSYSRIAGADQPFSAYVGVVPAGDYVLSGDVTTTNEIDSFCFAAPVFHIEAGSVSYIGTLHPYYGNIFRNRLQNTALGWMANLARARDAVADKVLAARMTQAAATNGAIFDCTGDAMWAYRIPGAPDLPAAPAASPPSGD